MLNETRIEKNLPETITIDGFPYNFVEYPNDVNGHYDCEVSANISRIGIWIRNTGTPGTFNDPDIKYSVRVSKDSDARSDWVKQNGQTNWYGIYDLSQLDGFIQELPSYDNYPPAIHGERKWTERVLSRKTTLNNLLDTVGLSEAGWTNAEYTLEDGRRIDVVTETSEGFVSIEAQDASGKCDDLHFDKGTESYPMNLREEEGNCIAAIVVAADFTEAQIRRANEKTGVGWMIALVTAEEIDGKTIFTLVN